MHFAVINKASQAKGRELVIYEERYVKKGDANLGKNNEMTRQERKGPQPSENTKSTELAKRK